MHEIHAIIEEVKDEIWNIKFNNKAAENLSAISTFLSNSSSELPLNASSDNASDMPDSLARFLSILYQEGRITKENSEKINWKKDISNFSEDDINAFFSFMYFGENHWKGMWRNFLPNRTLEDILDKTDELLVGVEEEPA